MHGTEGRMADSLLSSAVVCSAIPIALLRCAASPFLSAGTLWERGGGTHEEEGSGGAVAVGGVGKRGVCETACGWGEGNGGSAAWSVAVAGGGVAGTATAVCPPTADGKAGREDREEVAFLRGRDCSGFG